MSVLDLPLEELVARLRGAARRGDEGALSLLEAFADLGDSVILRLAARRHLEPPHSCGPLTGKRSFLRGELAD